MPHSEEGISATILENLAAYHRPWYYRCTSM